MIPTTHFNPLCLYSYYEILVSVWFNSYPIFYGLWFSWEVQIWILISSLVPCWKLFWNFGFRNSNSLFSNGLSLPLLTADFIEQSNLLSKCIEFKLQTCYRWLHLDYVEFRCEVCYRWSLCLIIIQNLKASTVEVYWTSFVIFLFGPLISFCCCMWNPTLVASWLWFIRVYC